MDGEEGEPGFNHYEHSQVLLRFSVNRILPVHLSLKCLEMWLMVYPESMQKFTLALQQPNLEEQELLRVTGVLSLLSHFFVSEVYHYKFEVN